MPKSQPKSNGDQDEGVLEPKADIKNQALVEAGLARMADMGVLRFEPGEAEKAAAGEIIEIYQGQGLSLEQLNHAYLIAAHGLKAQS